MKNKKQPGTQKVKNDHLYRNIGKKRQLPRTAEEFHAKPQRFQEAHSKTLSVISRMRTSGVSLRKAAQEFEIDPRTVVRFGSSAMRKKLTGQYAARASDKLLRVLITPSPEGLREIAVRGSKKASVLAKHANAIRQFAQTGKNTSLKQFQGKHIIDASGEKIPFLTDLSEIERLANAGVLSFENLYSRSA